MKKTQTFSIIILVTLMLILSGCIRPAVQPTTEVTKQPTIKTLTTTNMKLTSSAFDHNQNIPPKYTCDADNISPPLTISDVPDGTESLALIVDDPDAPAKVWVHWIVWNIPADTTAIAENSAPSGIEGVTDFGKPGWGGPCPPSGTHRYFYKLYALDTELDLDSSAEKEALLAAMEGHILGQTELIGLYKKQ